MIGAIPAWLQVVLGLVVTGYGWLLVATSVDRSTSMRNRWPLYGLVIWAALWAMHPVVTGRTDSWSAAAFVGLVAYVLARRGRQIRGILDGEAWWPPHARSGYLLSVYLRPRAMVSRGWFSVAGVERMVTGPWAPDPYKPGGGWMWCVTRVVVRRRVFVLPYVSFQGAHARLALGWAPDGDLVRVLRWSLGGWLDVWGR